MAAAAVSPLKRAKHEDAKAPHHDAKEDAQAAPVPAAGAVPRHFTTADGAANVEVAADDGGVATAPLEAPSVRERERLAALREPEDEEVRALSRRVGGEGGGGGLGAARDALVPRRRRAVRGRGLAGAVRAARAVGAAAAARGRGVRGGPCALAAVQGTDVALGLVVVGRGLVR